MSLFQKIVATRPSLVLIYGAPKLGKTSLLARASRGHRRVIFLRTEDGSPADTPIEAGPIIETWRDIGDQIGEVIDILDVAVRAGEPLPIAVVAIDMVDGIEQVLTTEVCRRHGWNDLGDGEYGRGYLALKPLESEFFAMLSAVRDRGVTVVLIGGSATKTVEAPGADPYLMTVPRLHHRFATRLAHFVDTVLFFTTRTNIETEKGAFGTKKTKATGGSLRVVHCQPKAAYLAGSRYPMPASIPIPDDESGFDNLARHWPGQVDPGGADLGPPARRGLAPAHKEED